MKNAKIALQLVGLAVWTAAWLGSGALILNKLFPEERESKRHGRQDPKIR